MAFVEARDRRAPHQTCSPRHGILVRLSHLYPDGGVMIGYGTQATLLEHLRTRVERLKWRRANFSALRMFQNQ